MKNFSRDSYYVVFWHQDIFTGVASIINIERNILHVSGEEKKSFTADFFLKQKYTAVS